MVMRKEENVVRVVLPALATVVSLETVFDSITSRLRGSSFSNVKGVTLDSTNAFQVTLGTEPCDMPGSIPSRIMEEGNEVRFPISETSVSAFLEEIQHFTRAMRKKYPHSALTRPLSYSFHEGVFTVKGDTSAPAAENKPVRKEEPKQNVTPLVPKQGQKAGGTLLLIDGPNILNRAFYGSSSGGYILKRSDGTPTNAVRTFIEIFFNLLREFNPSSVCVAWDCDRKKTFRRSMFDGYKAHRDSSEKPVELTAQEPLIWDLLKEMGVPQLVTEPYECDDIIGSFSRKWINETNGEVYICSNDRDFYQLLHKRIHIIRKDKNGNNVTYTKDMLAEEYGLEPHQIIDLKALVGDKSDGITGVKGVGDSKAPAMLQKYKSVENLYANLEEIKTSEFKRYYKSLEAGYDSAILSKKLATIVDVPELKNVDVSRLSLQLNRAGMIEGFRKLEFKSFLERMGA
ncbi:5'-3' exonuclease [Aneurinibacillus tyrosinisolvens]|uniref:5'-3' exonuclease n=1 Tax=Aneurinibacillus tyrosinisolvens TaxID=1443435 RepID=UPI00069B6D7D|nr:5'-3' exonuclease H3TH domain-containing protein [Aneurinibacillus tyrosinisolvens]